MLDDSKTMPSKARIVICHPAKLSNEHGVKMKLFAEIQPPKQTFSGVLEDILHQNELICTKNKEKHELKKIEYLNQENS